MATPDDAGSEARDVVLVGPKCDDGEGYKVLRRREAGDATTLEVGELRAAKEGKPIHGELVRLQARPEHERLFDVDVVLPAPAPPKKALHAGPAQVATAAYRANWDVIFARDPDAN